MLYRYRKWDLGDGNTVIVRCEHDAVMHGPKGEEAMVNIKTLNEFDSKVQYKLFIFSFIINEIILIHMIIS